MAGVVDVRDYIESGKRPPNEKAEMGLLLKGAEAAACLWAEFAASGSEIAVAR